MTEEELREKILNLLMRFESCKLLSNVWFEYKTDQILTLFREAGWKSPEKPTITKIIETKACKHEAS